MVPSGAFGLPRTEDSGSVRAERWEDANRSKSDPVPRVRKEKTLQYIEVEPGTRLQGLEVCGDVRPVCMPTCLSSARLIRLNCGGLSSSPCQHQ